MTEDTAARDHGGDLDRARATWGTGPWLDLSTGINAQPYPVPDLPAGAWTALPAARDLAALEEAAALAYGAGVRPVALAGAQAAIQIVPRLRPPGTARVVGPTYNEHAAALAAQGWQVHAVAEVEALAGADIGVVVNPNNPDGRRWPPETLRRIAATVGLLVVDESFADPAPETSLAPALCPGTDTIVVLRSFGKFYGLAGVRLGFALAGEALAARLRALAGPWAVGGPALTIGRAALADLAWQTETRARLFDDAARLDALATSAGWRIVGGTPLFRTYATPDATAAQETLAKAYIWSRVFPYSATWLRLGLPGDEAAWNRLAACLLG